MSQMNVQQSRVIDPVLSTVARGYKNARFTGMILFPYVPVGQRGGKIISFGKEHFRLYNTGRAPGANIAQVQIGYAAGDYSLTQHAIQGKLPVELMDEAQAVPGIDLGRATVNTTQDIISLRLEYDQAQLARAAANYGTDNKLALTGNDKWSDPDSDPVVAVQYGKEIIRSKIGVRPNVLHLGGSVLASLQVHPKILDRIKYTGRDVATVELLASLFGVQKVESGDSVYVDESGVMKDVWGGDAILAYTELGDLASAGTPSYGYTYRLRNHPLVKEARFDDDTQSWLYPVFDEVKPVIAGADAGFLFSDAA